MSCVQTITTDSNCLFLSYLDNCKPAKIYPPLRLYEDRNFVYIDGQDSRQISIDKNNFEVELDGTTYTDKSAFITAMNAQILCVNQANCGGGGGGTPSAKSKLERLKTEADDLKQDITYLDPTNPVDRRPQTIVYSSALLSLTATETFTYDGSAGDYYVITIELS